VAGQFPRAEQCAWNVLICKEYHPPRPRRKGDPAADLAEEVRRGTLTIDELERRYATLLFAKTGSYQETSRRLGWNWRRVKARSMRNCCGNCAAKGVRHLVEADDLSFRARLNAVLNIP